MKNRIMRIVGLIVYYLFASLTYRYVFIRIMEGFEKTDFIGGTMQYVVMFFETVLIQNIFGMALFSVIIIYEIVCIIMKR